MVVTCPLDPTTEVTVVTGPTAAGKTELALRWAEAVGGEIINGDALLFYRGMDVGTAKPTPAEQARVPHHLLDVVPVAEGFDVARYVAAARRVLAEVRSRGRPALVVGGSGFYLRAWFAAVVDEVVVRPEVRAQVAAWAEAEGVAGLVARLEARHPGGLGELDRHNPRRVVRALERSLVTGQSPAEAVAALAARPSAFAPLRPRLIVIEREDADLARRIEDRTAAMLRAGLVEEVRRLQAEGLERNPSAASAIGYREVLACLAGQAPWAELSATISAHTRQLVRKQRTWLRHQLPADRIVFRPAAGPDRPVTDLGLARA